MNEGEVNGKPLYEHPCSACQWLGVFGIDGQNADLYFCNGGGGEIGSFMGPSVLARYSEDPPDESSGLIFAVEKDGMVQPYLQEAAIRAEAKGLLPSDWRDQILNGPFGGGRRMRVG